MPTKTLTLTAYEFTHPSGAAERTTDARTVAWARLEGQTVREVMDTYRVGDAVEVHSYGRWRSGTVVSLGRTRVTVDYARNAGGTRHRKAFAAGEIRPAEGAPMTARRPGEAGEWVAYVVGDGRPGSGVPTRRAYLWAHPGALDIQTWTARAADAARYTTRGEALAAIRLARPRRAPGVRIGAERITATTSPTK